MATSIIIILALTLLGITLMMAEIFLLPGITVAGIIGGIMMAGSAVYAFLYVGNNAGYITIGVNITLFVITLFILVKSNALDRIALKTDIESKVEQSGIKQLQFGNEGISVSRLNPFGKATFGDDTLEVKSHTGEFIDAGQALIIIKIESNTIFVEAKTNSEIKNSANEFV